MRNPPPAQDGASPFWRRLSRITTSGRYIPEIDGLRFLCLVPVLMVHLSLLVARSPLLRVGERPESTLVGRFVVMGGVGVPLFFAISGFILGVPFAMQHLAGAAPVRVGAYFKRRVLRLEPTYLATLLLLYVVNAVARGPEHAPGRQLPHLLASAGYAHGLVFGERSPVNPVAWSLEVEFQFYALAPLLALAYRRPALTRRAAMAVAAVLGCAMQTVFLPRLQELNLHLSLLPQVQYFLVGMLCADLYVSSWREPAGAGWGADVLGAGGYVMAFLAWGPVFRGFAGAAALTACVAAVLYGTLRGRLFRRFLRARPLIVVGGMCYTIYLVHYPVMYALSMATGHLAVGDRHLPNLAVQALIILPVVFCCSALVFVVLERPFMHPDWPARLAERVRAMPAVLGPRPRERARRQLT